MKIKRDPTKTTTLRAKFVEQFRSRFGALARACRISIVDNDCFGLMNPLTVSAEVEDPPKDWKDYIIPIPEGKFRFDTDPNKIKNFMSWLSDMEEESIFQVVRRHTLGGSLEHQWSDIYISRAYKKGIIWAGVQIKKNKALMKHLELDPKDVNTTGIGANKAFTTQLHADRVGILYTRTFTDLKGITAAMDAQLSRILAEGIALGQHPSVIAMKITKTISTIGKTRATVLARTEVIRAHHLASIQTYRSYGVVGVKVNAEWSTAGDSRVCTLCGPLQGKIYTVDEVEPLIPLHPQCRCAALPTFEEKPKE